MRVDRLINVLSEITLGLLVAVVCPGATLWAPFHRDGQGKCSGFGGADGYLGGVLGYHRASIAPIYAPHSGGGTPR